MKRRRHEERAHNSEVHRDEVRPHVTEVRRHEEQLASSVGTISFGMIKCRMDNRYPAHAQSGVLMQIDSIDSAQPAGSTNTSG